MRGMGLLALGALLAVGPVWAGKPQGPPSARAPVALEQWLTEDDALWQLSPDQFMAAHQAAGFAWVAGTTNLARAAHAPLMFCGMPVMEAAAKFERGRLQSLTLILYNRGDAGPLTQAAFEAAVAKTVAQLDQWAGSRGSTPRESTGANHTIVRRQAWRKGPHRLDLTCGFTLPPGDAYRSEFVRLEISELSASSDPNLLFGKPALTPLRAVTAADLWSRVKRSPDGDVVVTGVPMVDQGQKGYCAVAVAERLMRYYGREVDQHEFAQMASTSARGGTTTKGMLAALEELGGKLGLDVLVVQEFSVTDLRLLLADYNALARQNRRPEITLGNGPITLTEIYRAMDTALLRQARRRRDGARAEFKAAVTKHVNAGVPLAWGVIAGKVAEEPPVKGTGGHMRLIIGYNDRTGEILYTDTWGAGHELKRLALDDAWAISLSLYRVTPRSLRL